LAPAVLPGAVSQVQDLAAGTITGRAFEDRDGDGAQDPGEPGLAGWTLYLDQNRNGRVDAGEGSTTSDAGGSYTLGGLAPGTYAVAELLPPGWAQTSPGRGADSLELAGHWDEDESASLGRFTASAFHEEPPGSGTGHTFSDVWGDGNYAYLGHFGNEGGVDIIDVSDPAHPTKAATFLSPFGFNDLRDVEVQNGVGFFSSDSGGGVHVVDLSNPRAPVQLARITSAIGGHDRTHTLSVDGNYLYEADSRTPNIRVFDIRNPSSPRFVRTIVSPSGGPVHEVTARNGRLYTAVINATGYVDIFDIRDVEAGAPLLGSFVSGSFAHTSWPTDDGRYVAVAREVLGGDVRLWDITNPAAPALVSVIGLPTSESYSAHQVMIRGNLLYVSWYQAGVRVFDISDPSLPSLVGSYDTFPGPSTASPGTGASTPSWDPAGSWPATCNPGSTSSPRRRVDPTS
jgi:hypothetical protein